MKLKVCGLRDNWEDVANLQPDFIGLIFFAKSGRYVELNGPIKVGTSVEKIGVFVKAEIAEVLSKVSDYQLDYIQLHGDESLEYIKELKTKLPEIKIIKVLRVVDEIPSYEDFEKEVDMFLFDTKVKEYGGTGSKFDWSILKDYKGAKPFLLAGGVSPEDLETIKGMNMPSFLGVDINSQFEDAPGLKNIDKVAAFAKAIRE